MYAAVAATYILAYCRETFDKDPESMSRFVLNGSMIDAFDHTGYVTHKYLPTEKLNKDLGQPDGAGVFAAYGMKDGSYLLMTCHKGVAYWSGKPEDEAKFPAKRETKV